MYQVKAEFSVLKLFQLIMYASTHLPHVLKTLPVSMRTNLEKKEFWTDLVLTVFSA